ncbi:GAF domain-containing protein, partial [Aromatoleum sp.]|uniref:GAF domain-containing protein n=1 Tax=Aromatoleum sp. TaxID=2307007 RepID=UPI002FC7CC41
MLSRTRISTRLIAGFSLILLATLCLGLMGVRSIERLAEASQNMFKHPFTVSIAIREAMTEVLVAQQVMNTLVHYTSPEDVERFQQKLDTQRKINDQKLALIRERYLGNPLDIDRIERALSDWREARAATVALLKGGRRAEAIALYGAQGDRLVEAVLERMETVSGFASDRARTFGEAAAGEAESAVELTSIALLLILVGGTALTFFVTASVRRSLRNAADEVKRVIESSTEKARVVEAIGSGDLSQEIAVSAPLKVNLEHLPDDETGVLLRAAAQLSVVQSDLDASFRNMTSFLRQARQASRDADWVKSGLNELNSLMRGEQAAPELADKALTYLVEYLTAGVGALYLLDERAEALHLAATYAFTRRRNLGDRFRLGEGLIGQAARERKPICLANVPADYLPIGSALGESVPKVVLALPLLHGTRLIGALEIGAFADFTDLQLEFLGLAQEALAIGLDVSQSRERMTELLEETQQQAEELRVQQEELQQSNEELEERAQMLEQQRENIRAKNREIEVAAEDLRRKAEE